jgi:phospholipid transport system substrate-binding protein
MKKFLSGLFAALGLAVTAQVHAAAAPLPPDQMIEKATTEFQGLISANHEKYKADLDGFYKVVDEKVVPYFDTKGIAQLVLGRNWKAASAEQRQRFEAAFKTSLICKPNST